MQFMGPTKIKYLYACVYAKLLEFCSTLCDPIDHSMPDTSVYGIFQARILEYLPEYHALLRGSSQPRDQTHISYISCISRGVLYHQCHHRSPNTYILYIKVKVKSLSHVRLFVTPWTVASQAPPPMGFSRQEYWSGVPFSSPGDLPDPGIERWSSALWADAFTN